LKETLTIARRDQIWVAQSSESDWYSEMGFSAASELQSLGVSALRLVRVQYSYLPAYWKQIARRRTATRTPPSYADTYTTPIKARYGTWDTKIYDDRDVEIDTFVPKVLGMYESPTSLRKLTNDATDFGPAKESGSELGEVQLRPDFNDFFGH